MWRNTGLHHLPHWCPWIQCTYFFCKGDLGYHTWRAICTHLSSANCLLWLTELVDLHPGLNFRWLVLLFKLWICVLLCICDRNWSLTMCSTYCVCKCTCKSTSTSSSTVSPLCLWWVSLVVVLYKSLITITILCMYMLYVCICRYIVLGSIGCAALCSLAFYVLKLTGWMLS